MEVLSFVIDADCGPAAAALDAVGQGISDLGGKAAVLGVEVEGAGAAIGALGAVERARRDAGGMLSIGYGGSGDIDAARSDLKGLTSDLQGAAAARNALSGAGGRDSMAPGLRGASEAASSMAAGLGRASSAIREMAPNLGRAASGAERLASGLRGASEFAGGLSRGLGRGLDDTSRALGAGAGELGNFASTTSAFTGRAAPAFQSATNGMNRSIRDLHDAGSGLNDTFAQSGDTFEQTSDGGFRKLGESADSTASIVRRSSDSIAKSFGDQADAARDLERADPYGGGGLVPPGGGGGGGGWGGQRAIGSGGPRALPGPSSSLARRGWWGWSGDSGGPAGSLPGGGGGGGGGWGGGWPSGYPFPRPGIRPPGGGGGWPPPPPGGGGGGGGGDDGGDRGERRGGRGDDGLGWSRRATSMAGMAGLVGVAEGILTGAAGIVAVGATIAEVPRLADAANEAMGEFSRGIRDTGSAAADEGAPGIRALGGEMQMLGETVGQIGAQHLPTVISGMNELAPIANTAMKSLNAAVAPNIEGITNMAGAIMEGISTDTSVQGIKNVGDALRSNFNAEGVENLTSALSSVATLGGKVATDLAGSLGNLPGVDSENMGGAIIGGGIMGALTRSPMVGAMAAASIYAAQSAGESGRADLQTPMVAGGAGGAMGGAAIAKQLGKSAMKGGALGWLGGTALGAGAAQLDHKAGTGSMFTDTATGAMTGAMLGFMAGGPIGALIGGLGGAAAGYGLNMYRGDTNTDPGSPIRDASGFQVGVDAPFGWNRNADGKLYPSQSKTDTGTGEYKAPPPTPPTARGGAGMDRAGMVPPDTGLRPPAGAQDQPSSMRQLTEQSRNLGASLDQLGGKTSNAGGGAAAMGQQYNAASQMIRQMPQVANSANNALGSIPQQASDAMASAQDNVNVGGSSLGAAVPKAFAGGVDKNAGVACNAAADMGASAEKCAANALDSASPSKKFQVLGEGTGTGFAIGVKNTSGEASAAVFKAMSGAVRSGEAALAAQSPSKAFQGMGANATRQMGQNAARGIGQQSGPGGPRGLNPQTAGLAGGTGMPGAPATEAQKAAQLRSQQALNTAKAAGGETKALTEQQKAEAAARRKALEGNAMSYRREVMDRIVKHNERAILKKEQRDQNRADAKEAALRGVTPRQVKDERIERQDSARLYNEARQRQVDKGKQGPGSGRFGAMFEGKTRTEAAKAWNDGRNIGTEFSKGLEATASRANKAGGNAAGNAANGAKKKAKISSPSGLMYEYGRNMAEGLMLGMNSGAAGAGASAAGLIAAVTTQIDANGLSGFAMTGLKLGYVMGENAVTGAQQAIQRNTLTSLASPTGLSQQAMMALAATGLGAPAGAGGATWNIPNSMVTFAGAGSAANPLSVPAGGGSAAQQEHYFNLFLDGKPIRVIAEEVTQQILQSLADRIPRQRN